MTPTQPKNNTTQHYTTQDKSMENALDWAGLESTFDHLNALKNAWKVQRDGEQSRIILARWQPLFCSVHSGGPACLVLMLYMIRLLGTDLQGRLRYCCTLSLMAEH